jgi:putative nucleotidyltransferase with HDIG domain
MGFSLSSQHTGKRPRGGAGRDAISARDAYLLFSLAALTWGATVLLLQGGRGHGYSELAPGQTAPATVIAAVDFTCQDLAQTQLNMREAADSVPPVFQINNRQLITANRALDKLFYRLAQLRRSAGESDGRAVDLDRSLNDTLFLLEITLPPSDLLDLVPEGAEENLLSALKQALADVWPKGIVSAAERESAFQGVAQRGVILVQALPDQKPRPLTLDQLLLPEEALQAACSELRAEWPSLKAHPRALEDLLRSWITPNLRYDPYLTEQMRADARAAVRPVTMKVREGATLAERGQSITPQILEQLGAHDLRLAELENPIDRRLKQLGYSGILLIGLLLSGGLMKVLCPEMLRRPKCTAMLLLISLLTLLIGKGVLFLSAARVLPPGLAPFASPLGIAPLLGAILAGAPAALVLGLWTSLAAAVVFGNSFTVFCLGLIATVVSALIAHGAHRRSTVFRVGLRIGLGWALFALCLAALHQPTAAALLTQAGGALASGLLCALLTMLLIPVFEFFFGMTTDITLLEHSDLGHPLLQRLALEAPGTYHHSLMVAGLGQAAASEIGCNALLVRVCAYYHDIGKLTRPEFFSENQTRGINPHDDLPPAQSAQLVMAHVKDGVSLARSHKLPRPIIDAIQQHHGTSVVAYFYHRARQLAEAEGTSGGGVVDEREFRYEGPRPSSRELGILLLADGVEAASRAMGQPTAARIEHLVQHMVQSRLDDGQLDDGRLTLQDISAIKRSFIFTLTTMLHTRIEYPTDEDRGKQPLPPASSEPADADDAYSVAYGAGTTA